MMFSVTQMHLQLLLIWCTLAFGHEPGKCRDGVAKDLTPHHLLMQDVFCLYDKGVRPVLQHSANITIRTKLFINFFSLDEVNNVMHIHAWLVMTWKDAFLKWTPSDYGNINLLQVSIKDIWVPDLSIYNSGDLSMSMGFKGSQCQVRSNGDILCVPAVKWPAYCLANYRFWPYDIQECKLIIGSWNHNGETVDITLSEGGFRLDNFTESREWELKNLTAFKNMTIYECCPNETHPTAEYRFIIQRHASAYSATVVIPSLVCVCMVLATFWLPPKLPHRMSLCLVSIVCHCLYLQYLGAKLPSNGDVTPVIFIFFRGSLIICGATLVWSVTLLSLSSESTSRSIGKETGLFTVSRLLEVIQKPWVAQILCLGQLRPKMAPVEGDGAALAEDAGEVNGTNVNEWLILSPALDCLAFYVFSLAYALMIIITLIPLHN